MLAGMILWTNVGSHSKHLWDLTGAGATEFRRELLLQGTDSSSRSCEGEKASPDSGDMPTMNRLCRIVHLVLTVYCETCSQVLYGALRSGGDACHCGKTLPWHTCRYRSGDVCQPRHLSPFVLVFTYLCSHAGMAYNTTSSSLINCVSTVTCARPSSPACGRNHLIAAV